MNILLWVLQVLLAAAFAAHGLMFLFPPAGMVAAMNASIPPALRLFIGVAEVLAAIGLTLGLIGALGLARLLSATNRGMHFENPLALAAPALLLVAVALIASWLPARRAARINPIEALRAE